MSSTSKMFFCTVLFIIQSVYSAPSLAILRPTSGERLSSTIRSTRTIRWSANETINNVKLEYTADNGTSWIIINASVSNIGYYDWTVPNINSDQCRLRITDVGNGSVSDESETFQITYPSITITTLNSATSLVEGTLYEITWYVLNKVDDNVSIHFSSNGGADWQEVVASTPNDGSYEWTVTDLPKSSSNCLIKVTDIHCPVEVTDQNDSKFSVLCPPVLASIGPKEVHENTPLQIDISGTDPDDDPITITAESTPTGAVFNDNGDGTATLNWTPTFEQSGQYNVKFTITSGTLSDTETVAITVVNVDRAPILAAIGAQTIAENAPLTFEVTASDPDGNTIAITTTTLPTGADFVDNDDGTGDFSWTPDFAQAGQHTVKFTSTSLSLIDTETVVITVSNTDRAPILASIGNSTGEENSPVSFTVSASDPDGESVTLRVATIPTGASFIDNGDGTGSFTWTPTFAQAGDYPITFKATSASLVDSESITISIANVDRAPSLTPTGDKVVDENAPLSFTIDASDPDSDPITFQSNTLPTGATLTDNSDGTATFTWTPTFKQSGKFTVVFYVNAQSLVDSESIEITVNNVDRLPQLAAIGNKSTPENSPLSFVLTATDPDLDPIILSSTALPVGATLTDNGDGTGSFVWTPNFSQAGEHTIKFTATALGVIDTETIVITVTNVDRPPILNPVGNKTTNESAQLLFLIQAADPDGEVVTLSTSTLPTGATFTDNSDGTGTFTWTPTFEQSGAYPLTFKCQALTLTDSETVTITVNDINRAPVLSPIGNKKTVEETALTFPISATDPDGDLVSLTSSSLPSGATLTDNGDGTGTFSWTPLRGQAGAHPITFKAIATALHDSENIVITVDAATSITFHTTKIKKPIRFLAAPNPTLQTSPRISFYMIGDIQGDARLAIYDQIGNEVHRQNCYIRKNTTSKGQSFTQWNLRNRSGRKVSSGIYLAVLIVNDRGTVKKFRTKIGIKKQAR